MKKETPQQYRTRKYNAALEFAVGAPAGITGNRQMAAALVKAADKAGVKRKETGFTLPELIFVVAFLSLAGVAIWVVAHFIAKFW